MRPTRLMLAALWFLAPVALAAEPAQSVVLVGNYQALGVDAKRVTELEQALRAALGSQPVKLVSLEETEKIRRGLALCGEDAACVGSVGERAGARWVLGYGAGKVGGSVLVNLLWVDVVRGKTVSTASRKVAAAALPTVAGALVEEVLKDVVLVEPVQPEPPPPPLPAPPTPPPAVLVPAEPAAEPASRPRCSSGRRSPSGCWRAPTTRSSRRLRPTGGRR
ncbi:MAG: hypothetical protein H6Q89_4558 [Myxococcaceae bacterium]|nr:hypothetical protein [Myxococcaceae bacterium]